MSNRSNAASNAFEITSELRFRNRKLSKVKLHKLLFFIQAEHLAWYGTPAFPENIQAWKNGPVVARLWHEEKDSGRCEPEEALGLPDTLDDVITFVLARFRGMPGRDLVEITHNEGPWFEVTAGGTEIHNQNIPHDAMRQYAQRLPAELEAIREALKDTPRNRPFIADTREDLDSFFAA